MPARAPQSVLGTRATLADALHQAGDIARAAALFVQAEQIQAERQPDLPLLYSLSGYRYCDLWLTQGKAAEVLARYEDLVSVRGEEDPILDRALEDLLAGRAHAALAQSSSPAGGTGSERDAQLAAMLLDNVVMQLIEVERRALPPARLPRPRRSPPVALRHDRRPRPPRRRRARPRRRRGDRAAGRAQRRGHAALSHRTSRSSAAGCAWRSCRPPSWRSPPRPARRRTRRRPATDAATTPPARTKPPMTGRTGSSTRGT